MRKYIGENALGKLLALVRAALAEKADQTALEALSAQVGAVASALDDINGEVV